MLNEEKLPVAWRCGRFYFDWSKRHKPVVMGILNVTPDSFSDGGKFFSVNAAIEQAHHMIQAGAEIIDIGGESTRPGAQEISVQEELDRILPVIEVLLKENIAISVDTYKPQTMEVVAHLGVDMINDIWGLRKPEAIETVAKFPQLGLCLMHMQNSPFDMQIKPHYDDVLQEVDRFFAARLQALSIAKIESIRIVIDPGLGFGKTPEHNLRLINRLDSLIHFNCPIFMGASRKSTLRKITGDHLSHMTVPSVVAGILAADRGAHILRVHDVPETIAALKVRQAIMVEGLS